MNTIIRQFLSIVGALLVFGQIFNLLYSEIAPGGIRFAKYRPDKVDASAYYLAAQMIRDRAPLYDYKAQRDYALKLYQQPHGTSQRWLAHHRSPLLYYYPPYTVPIVAGLGSLSLIDIYYLSFGLSLILILIALGYAALKSRLNYALLGGLIASIFITQPFLFNMFHGQIALIACLGIYFYLVFSANRRSIPAALSLLVVFVKPQLGLPFLLIPLYRKEYRSLLFLGVFLAILTVGSTYWIGWDGLTDYLHSVMNLLRPGHDPSFTQPYKPVFPLHDFIAMSFAPDRYSCLLDTQVHLTLTKIIWSGCMLTGAIWVLRQPYDPVLKTLSATLFLFLMVQYHHMPDYNLISICLLVLATLRPALLGPALIAFCIGFSLIPNLAAYKATLGETSPDLVLWTCWIGTILAAITPIALARLEGRLRRP